jgi:hypothetical protein
MKRQYLLLSVALFLLPLLIPAQQPDIAIDTPDTRLIAAKKYAALNSLKDILGDMADAIANAQHLSEDDHKKLLEQLNASVRSGVIEEAITQALVKHFTTQELNALAEFYSSPAGKSAMKKFGPYMADILPVIQSETLRALQQPAPGTK